MPGTIHIPLSEAKSKQVRALVEAGLVKSQKVIVSALAAKLEEEDLLKLVAEASLSKLAAMGYSPEE